MSPSVERWLRRTIGDRVPLLLLHATKDDDHEEFRHALEGPMGTLIGQAGDRVQISTLSGYVRVLPMTLGIQQAIITRVQQWVDSVAGNQTADNRPARDAARV